MKQKTIRVLSTTMAIFLAIGFIWLLTIVGNKSKGPITDMITVAGEAVQSAEENIILSQREYKRANRLTWFYKYKTDSNLLRNPSEILLGAFDNQNKESFESTINLEDTLKTTFPLIHIYTAWGSKDEQQFPSLQVKAILELGSLPVITWEPWFADFSAEKFPNLRAPEKRDVGGMRDVAAGKYDAYIKEWAAKTAKIDAPIFIRLGHEMNDPYRYPWGPQNNLAKDFIAAWKHVHDVFEQQKATNVIWIWSPHPAYGFYEAFYPGAAYVDYVGVGILNYGTVATWSKWWSFGEIFGKHYSELAVFNKPIMITEFGCLNVGGKRDAWYEEALHQLPQKYPLIKSILFFHFSDDNTTTQQTINWYIKEDPATVKAIVGEIAKWKTEE